MGGGGVGGRWKGGLCPAALVVVVVVVKGSAGGREEWWGLGGELVGVGGGVEEAGKSMAISIPRLFT